MDTELKNIDKKHVKIVRNIFYRPEIEGSKLQSGWVVNWQLIYKYLFKTNLLYSTEEVCNTKEEAESLLSKHTLRELLPNIQHLLQA